MNFRRSSLQVGLVCLVVATSVAAQRETFVPSNDVSFSISVERSSYRAGAQIVLKYRVMNISNRALFAPRAWEVKCGGRPHVWAWFENSVGQHFNPGYAGSCDPDYDPKTVTERMSRRKARFTELLKKR